MLECNMNGNNIGKKSLRSLPGESGNIYGNFNINTYVNY